MNGTGDDECPMEIVFDEEGRMWVERPSTDGWRVYEVYDAAGDLIGEMKTPAAGRGRPVPRREPSRQVARRDERTQDREER
jgi:hypothetical protein